MASSNNDLIMYAIIAGAALYLYTDVKKGIKSIGAQPTYSREQSNSLLQKAGYTTVGSGNDFRVEVPGGVVYVPENAQLRRWESALLVADRYVPGTWLSRSVLS